MTEINRRYASHDFSFSPELKQSLKQFFPARDVKHDPAFGDPAEEFVEVILSAASWALEELRWVKLVLNKGQATDDLSGLIIHLEEADKSIRHLLPYLDHQFGISANALSCSNEIQAFIPHIKESLSYVKKLEKSKKHADKMGQSGFCKDLRC